MNSPRKKPCNPGWKPVQVHSPAINQPIAAWWQLKADYVLTLAVIPQGTQK